MRYYLRLSWWFISVCLYELAWLPLFVVGLIAVPIAMLCGQWEISYITGTSIFNAPRWLWLWGNDEDGYLADWYIQEHRSWSRWRVMFTWAAIRNNVNNLRFIKCLHPPQKLGMCHWEKRGNFTLIWQGSYSCLVYESANYWFRAGWKYIAENWESVGWKTFGVGFGIRLIRKQLTE